MKHLILLMTLLAACETGGAYTEDAASEHPPLDVTPAEQEYLTRQAVFTPFDPPAPPGQAPGPIDSSDTQAICSAWFGICVNGEQGCRTQPVSFYYCLASCWTTYNNCVKRGGH